MCVLARTLYKNRHTQREREDWERERDRDRKHVWLIDVFNISFEKEP